MISKFFTLNAQNRLLLCLALLLAISTVSVYSMGFFQNYGQKSARMFFASQCVFSLLSLALIFALSRQSAALSRRILLAALGCSLAACIALPLLPGSLVVATKGATRWLRLGPLSLAPLEFLKIGTIWALAWTYSRRIEPLSQQSFWRNFCAETRLLVPSVMMFALVFGYVYLTQNDIGQALVMSAVLLAMALTAGIRVSTVLIWAALGFCAFGALVYSSTRRLARIQEWWAMVQDFVLPVLPDRMAEYLRLAHSCEPYQISHGLNAIANGGMLGQGLGLGAYKLGFLSEVHTDFILAGIAEELGLLGLLGVYALLFCVSIWLFRIAMFTPTRRTQLFCCGMAFCWTFSALLNAYGTSGLLPLKGIAVPFLSYGGSSMLASALGIGVVLSFYREQALSAQPISQGIELSEKAAAALNENAAARAAAAAGAAAGVAAGAANVAAQSVKAPGGQSAVTGKKPSAQNAAKSSADADQLDKFALREMLYGSTKSGEANG